MKEEKKNSQQIYKIRVYKDFDFPSFSIDKNNLLSDLSFKCIEEVKENSHNNEFFNFEIVNILPFSLGNEIEEITGNMDYDFFIKEIALESTRENFGDLDYETNPKIFEKVNKTDVSVTFNLKPEVENFFIKQVRKYASLFNSKKIIR